MTTLQVAGALAIFVAVGHGWMGDKALRAQPLAPATKNFVRAAYQFGTAGWLAGGALLLASTGFTDTNRHTLALVLLPLFGFGAAVNAWFTKGRHPGWVLLAVVCGLIATGL